MSYLPVRNRDYRRTSDGGKRYVSASRKNRDRHSAFQEGAAVAEISLIVV